MFMTKWWDSLAVERLERALLAVMPPIRRLGRSKLTMRRGRRKRTNVQARTG